MTTKDSKSESPIRELLDVMAALRTPVTGCPWDLEQDFSSIVPYTIEEAYEVADAISRDDAVDLKDELGDLLLQVVYHARMAEERELFDFDDVAYGIAQKMLRRHPHVFGTAEERAAGPQVGSWDRIKTLEKKARSQYIASLADDKRTLTGSRPNTKEMTGSRRNNKEMSGIGADTSTELPTTQRTLSDIPATLPALPRAIKLQNKAAKVGFDWPSLTPVFDKMREELAELEAAHQENASGGDTMSAEPSAETIEEFGDLMFVMANVARHMKIDPEDALRLANVKFQRRFEGIEDHLAAAGKTPVQSDLAEMDALWDAVKVEEKSQK